MQTISNIKVVVTDDHPVFAKGIAGLINDTPGMENCAIFKNGKLLVDWYDGTNADVLLVDLHMPVLDGIETCKQILHSYPAAKIIIVSVNDDHQIMQAIKKLGVCAYLLKTADPEDYIKLIVMVYGGAMVFSDLQHLVKPKVKTVTKMVKLSDKEMKVLTMIVKGKTNLQIAAELYNSPLTIKTHRQNLLLKLAVHNTAELIAKAASLGFF